MMQQEPIYQKLMIKEIIEETAHAKTFLLSPLDDKIPFYKSGQFLTFNFSKSFGDERRSYSISSAPIHDEPLSITVKRVENGEFSRYFNDHAQVGDILDAAGVGGLFVLPEEEEMSKYRQIFFLAAGSGITPVFSIIKSILNTDHDVALVLIYSNKNAQDTIFYDQLIQLVKESKGRLVVDFLFSSSNNILKSRLNNSLLASMLGNYTKAKPEEILCYICGPVDYMDTVGITLLTEGIPKENIKKENFVKYVPEITELPPDTEPHWVSIKLANETVQLKVQYPLSILHEAQKQGITLPYSCESGQCGSCAARCTQGHVWIAYNEILTERELSQGLVLTCQGFPYGGDVSLEY